MGKIVFVYNKLRGRIIEKYGSMDAFAAAIGLSAVSLSRKLTNKAGISREEIVHWSELLGIPAEEYGAYFFAREV